MFPANKIGWTKAGWIGIVFAFALLTAGMIWAQGMPQGTAASDARTEVAAVRQNQISQNQIRKMQEALRDKGHYRGPVDGVFGLRTRASIRAYQKAEKLPVTGQLDAHTAGKLGVRPEDHAGAKHETTQGKPSAGVKWAKGSEQTSRRRQKTVKPAAAAASGQSKGDKTLQAENDKHPQ